MASFPFSAQHESRRGFASDNLAGASPEVIEAIAAHGSGTSAPYGADDCTSRATQRLRDVFERDVSVFFVPTGTAANALCLSVLVPPWGKIFCHPQSHIHNDECAAPEFYTGGAKIITVAGPHAKIDPSDLRRSAVFMVGDVHSAQPACASITQSTEAGSVYGLDQVQAIGAVCR